MFPISLDLEGRPCLVVGGGAVALRKVKNLLECGARVRVVALNCTEEMKNLHREGKIALEERAFNDKDVQGQWLVFAATNDAELNRRIHSLCESKGILVNVVDSPENCNFFVPATVQRGALQIAVSTGGKSPLLARIIKEKLNKELPFEYEDYVELLGEARLIVKERFADETIRRRIFEELISLDLMPLLQSGRKEEAREQILACISCWQD